MKRLVIAVVLVGLLAAAAWVYFNSEQLGLILPSKDELVHLADVAAGETGDKSIPKWKEFLARSAKFAEENPNSLEIWMLRASGALAVGDQQVGQEASEHLARLHKQGDPVLDKLIELLWAKGWFPTRNLDYTLTVSIANQLMKVANAGPAYLSLDVSKKTQRITCTEYLADGSFHDAVILDFGRFKTITVEADKNSVASTCELLGSNGFVEYPSEGKEYDQRPIVLKNARATELATALFKHIKELLSRGNGE